MNKPQKLFHWSLLVEKCRKKIAEFCYYRNNQFSTPKTDSLGLRFQIHWHITNKPLQNFSIPKFSPSTKSGLSFRPTHILVLHKNLLNSKWLLWIYHKDLKPQRDPSTVKSINQPWPSKNVAEKHGRYLCGILPPNGAWIFILKKLLREMSFGVKTLIPSDSDLLPGLLNRWQMPQQSCNP